MTGEYEWIKEGVYLPPMLRIIIIATFAILLATLDTTGMSNFGIELYGLRRFFFVLLGVAFIIAVVELVNEKVRFGDTT